MRIKKWKMFLESIEDYGDEVNTMKKMMLKAFEELILRESIVRPLLKLSGDSDGISQVADQIISSLVEGMTSALSEDDRFPQEIKIKISQGFAKSLGRAREVMINDSFKSGIELSIEEFAKIMVSVKKSMNSEGEEWKEEKVKGYEEMSNVELRKLIDIALDERDYLKVSKLSSFLSESILLDQVQHTKLSKAIELTVSNLVEILSELFVTI